MRVIFKALVPIILFLIGISFHIPGLADNNDWQFAKEKEGVKVYTRPIPGSAIKEYRGEGIVDANINSLMALMDDTSACVDWMLNCKEPLLLEKVSLIERYVYQVNNLPWPVKDRQMVVRVLVSQDVSSRRVTLDLEGIDSATLSPQAQAKIPINDEYVWVEKLKGFWQFEPINEQQTRAVYQMHVELGGKLSPVLINARTPDSPIKTIIKMREVVKEDKYHCFNPF